MKRILKDTAITAVCVVARLAMSVRPKVARGYQVVPEVVWNVDGWGKYEGASFGWVLRAERTLAKGTLGEEPVFGRFVLAPREDEAHAYWQRLAETKRRVLGETHWGPKGKPLVVLGSDANLAKGYRFLLGSPEARARAEEYFPTAEALGTYLNILVSEVKKTFVLQGEEYAVVSTWGDLRGMGFFVPAHHGDDEEVPDSQVWVDKPGPGWQVRFATGDCCGKGKTFSQHNWEHRMRAMGLRAIIAHSCLKSGRKDPQGPLCMGLKRRNEKPGTIKSSAFVGLLLSTPTGDGDGELWAQRVLESNQEFYSWVQRAMMALNSPNPSVAKKAAQEVIFRGREDGNEDVQLYSAAEAALAGGWHPRTPAILGQVRVATARLFQAWAWGLGQEFTGHMVSCDSRLKPGQVSVSWLPEGRLCALRYPIRHAQSMQNVVNVHLEGCSEATVAADVAKSLDGDYDGDIVGFTNNQVFCDAVEAAHEHWGHSVDPHSENEWVEIGERFSSPVSHLPEALSRMLHESSGSKLGPYTNAAMRAAALGDKESLGVLAAFIQAAAEGLKRESKVKSPEALEDLLGALVEEGPEFLSREATKPTKTFVGPTKPVKAPSCWLEEHFNTTLKCFQGLGALPRNHREFEPVVKLGLNSEVEAQLPRAKKMIRDFGLRMTEIMNMEDDDRATEARDLLYGKIRAEVEAHEDSQSLIGAILSRSFFRTWEEVRSDGKGSLAFIAGPEEVAAWGQKIWSTKAHAAFDAMELDKPGAKELRITAAGKNREEKAVNAAALATRIRTWHEVQIIEEKFVVVDSQGTPMGVVWPKKGYFQAKEIKATQLENRGSYVVVTAWDEL